MAPNDEEPPTKIQKLSEADSDAKEAESSYFSIPRFFSDMVLVVEGRKFHVHKSTLAMASPVFERMFSSNFKEKKADEIDLPGKKAEEIEVLLTLIYRLKPDDELEVDDDNYKFLLHLADEYQIQRVKDLCIEHMSDNMGVESALENYGLAVRYNLECLATQSLDQISNFNVEFLTSNSFYGDFSDQIKFIILEDRIKKLETLVKKYTLACNKAVQHIHISVMSKVHNYKCEHAAFHKNGDRKKYDRNCYLCTRKVYEHWPKKCSHITSLKEAFKSINDFIMASKYFNIPKE